MNQPVADDVGSDDTPSTEELIWALTRRLDEMDAYRFKRSSQVIKQMWFIIFLGVFGLVLVAWHGENNAHRIEQEAAAVNQTRYQNCMIRLETQVHFNETREDAGRAIVALSPDAPEAAKTAMMQNMINSKQLPLPQCSRP